MTKTELAQAQALHTIYFAADRVAEARDPRRKHRDDVANHCDVILRHANRAFRELTGRDPSDVRLWELSTVTPAPWAKEE